MPDWMLHLSVGEPGRLFHVSAHRQVALSSAASVLILFIAIDSVAGLGRYVDSGLAGWSSKCFPPSMGACELRLLHLEGPQSRHRQEPFSQAFEKPGKNETLLFVVCRCFHPYQPMFGKLLETSSMCVEGFTGGFFAMCRSYPRFIYSGLISSMSILFHCPSASHLLIALLFPNMRGL